MNVLRFLSWMRQRGWEVRFYGDPDTKMHGAALSFDVPTRAVRSRTRNGDLLNSWRLSRLLRLDGVRWLTIHQSHDLFMGVLGRRLAGSETKLIYSQHMHIGGDKKDPYHRWLYGQLDAFITPVQWPSGCSKKPACGRNACISFRAAWCWNSLSATVPVEPKREPGSTCRRMPSYWG